jgi:hypothetical protein
MEQRMGNMTEKLSVQRKVEHSVSPLARTSASGRAPTMVQRSGPKWALPSAISSERPSAEPSVP